MLTNILSVIRWLDTWNSCLFTLAGIIRYWAVKEARTLAVKFAANRNKFSPSQLIPWHKFLVTNSYENVSLASPIHNNVSHVMRKKWIVPFFKQSIHQQEESRHNKKITSIELFIIDKKFSKFMSHVLPSRCCRQCFNMKNGLCWLLVKNGKFIDFSSTFNHTHNINTTTNSTQVAKLISKKAYWRNLHKMWNHPTEQFSFVHFFLFHSLYSFSSWWIAC